MVKPPPEPNVYYHDMKECRAGNHDDCPTRVQPTSHIDTHATICRCCHNDHYQDAAKVRHTEWRITRNWLRSGDACKVKGVRGECRFIALVTNGTEYVEVADAAGRVRSVSPDDVRRLAKGSS